jgi:hypothetical protein
LYKPFVGCPSLLQDTFNLLPNLNVADLSRSFAVESNDMMLVLYLASLIRSVLALHDLIDNKTARMAIEREKVGRAVLLSSWVLAWVAHLSASWLIDLAVQIHIAASSLYIAAVQGGGREGEEGWQQRSSEWSGSRCGSSKRQRKRRRRQGRQQSR